MTLATAYAATGRRKSSVARVRLIPGAGKRTVNGVELEKYFCRISLSRTATEPLLTTNLGDKFDLIASVHGGGHAGQAGAICLGVARAIQIADPALRAQLGKEGFLTRDSRMKERKKYGQAGARKKFQFSKR